MKKFSVQYNVGSVKYLLNIHDGEKKHRDGSDFYDVKFFRNKKLFQKAQKELISQGYSLQ